MSFNELIRPCPLVSVVTFVNLFQLILFVTTIVHLIRLDNLLYDDELYPFTDTFTRKNLVYVNFILGKLVYREINLHCKISTFSSQPCGVSDNIR